MQNSALYNGATRCRFLQMKHQGIFFQTVQLTPISLLVGLLAVLIFSNPLLVSAQQETNPAVAKAIADAKLNATARTNNLTWFTFGCLGGPIPITAAFFKTAPPTELLLGKSAGYIEEYIKAYKAKTRSIRLRYATMGWLSGITVGGILLYYRYDISDWLYWNL